MKRIKRVVITGLGVVAPTGIGKEAFWSACIAGRSGIRTITRFDASQLPTRIAGEVPDFDPELLGLTPDEIRILDRGTQFALAAANLAIMDSELLTVQHEEQQERTGVFMGTAMSSVDEGEKMWLRFTDNGAHPPHLSMQEQDRSSLAMLFELRPREHHCRPSWPAWAVRHLLDRLLRRSGRHRAGILGHSGGARRNDAGRRFRSPPSMPPASTSLP